VNRLVLFRAVLRKQLLLLVRYPVNTVAQFVSVYLFFAVIFFGGQQVAGAAITDSLDGIIVGFFLFTMTIAAYAGLAWDVTREAQWGTLEQLFMSPFGFGTVMATKAVVNVLMSGLWGGVILALMLGTTGRRLFVDALTVVPVGLLALASVVGVGLAFAGLALVYKRIENVFQLMQFAFVGLIAAPAAEVAWLRALPLVQGSAMLQAAMRDGVRFWQFEPRAHAVLVATAVGYAVAGFLVFRLAATRARREGSLGNY
jgi:ABC-2 type transport system permease protein